MKIHQPIVANVGHKVGAPTHGQLQGSRFSRHAHHLRIVACRRSQKIKNRLPDLAPAICVGHEINVRQSMLEHAALEDFCFRLSTASDPRPIRTSCEKRLDAIRRSPVQVVFWIFAIPQLRGDWNDALALIVGERHENVNRSQLRLLSPSRTEYGEEHSSSKERRTAKTNQEPSAPLACRSRSTAYRAPSGVSSCLK